MNESDEDVVAVGAIRVKRKKIEVVLAVPQRDRCRQAQHG